MFGRHGWDRISTLYGFNTVVVGPLQVVVLMNEAFFIQCFVMASIFSSLDD